MFWDFIATIAAGFVGAGFILFASVITRRRLPKWILPIVTGVAMLGYTIWSEMTWYHRILATLPSEIIVVVQHENKMAYRPWTYLWPYIDRFAIIDPKASKQHADFPYQQWNTLYFLARWRQAQSVPIVVDCQKKRHAILPNQDQPLLASQQDMLVWQAGETGDVLVSALCLPKESPSP